MRKSTLIIMVNNFNIFTLTSDTDRRTEMTSRVK